MEYGLRQINRVGAHSTGVLILVVMEYGLRLKIMANTATNPGSLNPCCNGIWSQTYKICHQGENPMS